ncbi:MAG: protein kinase, partial [Myxococcales bacterium]|nr:protein kinase [Myxococcales bacterium]
MSDETIDLPHGDDEGATLAAPPSQGASRSATGGESGGPARLPPGTVLAGRYRVVTALGKGGMGEVYRADDLKLDVPVALKFLPAALETDGAWRAQLLAEIKVARRITHPNVCRVYDLGEADGVYFLSMEYIDGEDLKSLLRRLGRPRWDKAIELGGQVCDGLAAAHEAGVLHRDLKPANLMIDGEGRARLTDFGLAALTGSAHDESSIAGTPLYMAPEQFRAEPASVASDVYALGLLLYELFTGRKVFESAGFAEAMKLHQRAIPTPPSKLRFGFDAGVEAIILRCLEKDPANRPAAVAEVSAALAQGLAAGYSEGAQIVTLVASDLVPGAQPSAGPGDSQLSELHDRLVRDLAEEHGGREVDKSGGFLLLFHRPVEAVRYALAYHRELGELAGEPGAELAARVGIHLGEVVLRRNSPRDVERGARPVEVEGFARSAATRLMSLAGGRQTLLSQGAFDVARRSAPGEIEGSDALRWLAHGDYVFAGTDEPAAVFEVGAAGFAPLAAPQDAEGAARVAAEDTIL